MSCSVLGEGRNSEGKYLNRVIKWSEKGIAVAGDAKHSKILISEWGMENCKTVDTPMGKEAEEALNAEDRTHRKPMEDEEATRYRRGVARVNFMAQDRPDLSVPSRVMSQYMANPLEGDEILLKRVIRYLAKYPRSDSIMEWQPCPKFLTVNIDSGWAGDRVTRKSTSGGTVRYGKHLLLHWSKLQATVALSSGEAELNAAVKGTSEVIGFKELLEDLGTDVNVEIETDASVCKSILLRHGSGKIKHLSTKQLWVQGAIESYGMKILKIPREHNPADLLTHSCTKLDHDNHLDALHQCRTID